MAQIRAKIIETNLPNYIMDILMVTDAYSVKIQPLLDSIVEIQNIISKPIMLKIIRKLKLLQDEHAAHTINNIIL